MLVLSLTVTYLYQPLFLYFDTIVRDETLDRKDVPSFRARFRTICETENMSRVVRRDDAFEAEFEDSGKSVRSRGGCLKWMLPKEGWMEI